MICSASRSQLTSLESINSWLNSITFKSSFALLSSVFSLYQVRLSPPPWYSTFLMLLKDRRLNLVGLVLREVNGALELNRAEMERPINRRWVDSEGNNHIMKRWLWCQHSEKAKIQNSEQNVFSGFTLQSKAELDVPSFTHLGVHHRVRYLKWNMSQYFHWSSVILRSAGCREKYSLQLEVTSCQKLHSVRGFHSKQRDSFSWSTRHHMVDEFN